MHVHVWHQACTYASVHAKYACVNDEWEWACIWWINLLPRQWWHKWPVCLIKEFYPGGNNMQTEPRKWESKIFSCLNCLWRVISSSHKRIGQLCICRFISLENSADQKKDRLMQAANVSGCARNIKNKAWNTNLGNMWTTNSCLAWKSFLSPV